MYPVLLEIGPIKIYSYGFMLVLAFYTCYYLLYSEMKRLKYDTEIASDIIFWGAVGGIVGSKVYYLVENFSRTIDDPLGMIFSGSGLVFLGGLMGGTFCVTMVFRKYKLSWLEFADICAPLNLIGYSLGRIGCFLVGDDYGIPCDLPWAIAFENGLPPTTITSFAYNYPWIDISMYNEEIIKVHPTQIYESIIAFFLFLFLWNIRKKIKTRGNVFFIYLILAGVERFSIEFLRLNEKYFFDTFSGAQLISFLMISIGIYFISFPLNDIKSENN